MNFLTDNFMPGAARLGPERGLNMYADWTGRIA